MAVRQNTAALVINARTIHTPPSKPNAATPRRDRLPDRQRLATTRPYACRSPLMCLKRQTLWLKQNSRSSEIVEVASVQGAGTSNGAVCRRLRVPPPTRHTRQALRTHDRAQLNPDCRESAIRNNDGLRPGEHPLERARCQSTLLAA